MNCSPKQPTESLEPLFKKALREALGSGSVRLVDVAFAWHINAACILSPSTFIALIVSWATTQGHGVLPLHFLTDLNWISESKRDAWINLQACLGAALTESQWIDYLRSSPTPWLGVEDWTQTPLIVHQNQRLALYRFWSYEQQIWKKLSQPLDPINDLEDLPSVLSDVLDPITVLLKHRFICITGGPGTGKTTLVKKVLIHYGRKMPSKMAGVLLAAPTGRGVQRLKESVYSCATLARLPVMTLHRLLGVSTNRPQGNFGPDHRLPATLVIIDEASMISTELLHHLVAALPESAQLILVGDPDQLPSVETGATFQPLVERLPRWEVYNTLTTSGGGGVHYQLTLPRRFEQGSDLDRLASLIKSGQTRAVLHFLESCNDSKTSIEWKPLVSQDELIDHLLCHYEDYLLAISENQPIAQIQKSFQKFRCLTALYDGPWGVSALNHAFTGRIDDFFHPPLYSMENKYFLGAPLMAVENDWNLQIANGDIGFLGVGGEDRVKDTLLCQTGDISKEMTEWYLAFPDHPNRPRYPLTAFKTLQMALVSTVHKAQGSEFDRVSLVVPTQTAGIASRAWFYTAVTRAKSKLTIFGSPTTLCQAIENGKGRYSFL